MTARRVVQNVGGPRLNADLCFVGTMLFLGANHLSKGALTYQFKLIVLVLQQQEVMSIAIQCVNNTT